MIQHRSFQVAISVALYLLIASYLPDFIHQSLYTVSLLIKDILLWSLPFSVCFFIGYAIVSFEKKAPLFILCLFLFEAISNACSVWYAYGCGFLVTTNIDAIKPQTLNDTFLPLWRLPFIKPVWWSADKGALLGVILGLSCTFFSFPKKNFFTIGKRIAETILTRFFANLIPIFILGFIARMHKTQLIHQVVGQYADLLLWLVIALFVYIAILFLLGGGKGSPSYIQRVKNLLPAFGISFSSGCSLSTMPWTISGTSKNLNNPDLAGAIIPSTTNIQQIGDCIINSFFCFIIFYHFNGYKVDILTWASFSSVFVLARFATAAVLGGAVFIMLPIYEAYLGFTPEMIAIILAFNVILDPLVTCTNVIANGALCRVFERVWGALSSRPFVQRIR
ncbi:MAG TPA: cation:dicarboxylase symporter family transporter [Chlamydiales bacterium]|nr:cation:dicarboxylase symporter family transporter [Chlamydiales bacterium]